METQNLSKADYYKSRNIVVPKIQHRIPPQPVPSTHFNSPLPSLSIQVMQYNEAMLRKEKHQMSKLNHEPQSHQKGVEIQDLRKQLANRMDQITGLKSELEKDQRRIDLFERQVFDLKSQIHKMHHEYENKIAYITSSCNNDKQVDIERISYLEKQLEKTKDFYANELKLTKQLFEKKIKEVSEKRANSSEQEFVRSLSKEIERYASENQRLQGQLILLERQIDKKSIHLENDNFELKAQLQKVDIEYQQSLKRTENEAIQRIAEIKSLNEKVNELKIRFDEQRARITQEKEYLEKVHSESQKGLQQNLWTIKEEKVRTDQQIFKLQIQINEFKDKTFQVQKKYNELTSKFFTLETEKQQIQLKHQRQVEEIKNSHRNLSEEEISFFKKNFEQKVVALEKKLEEKNIQISAKVINIQKFDEEIYEKSQTIKSLEQKEKLYKKQISEINEQNEKLTKEKKKLTTELEAIKKEYEKERKEFVGKFQKEQMKVLEQRVVDSEEMVMKMKRQLSFAKKDGEEQIKSMKEQLIKKQEEFHGHNFQFKQYKEDTKIKIEKYKKDLEEVRLQNVTLKSELETSKKTQQLYQRELKQEKQLCEKVKKAHNELLDQLQEKQKLIQRHEETAQILRKDTAVLVQRFSHFEALLKKHPKEVSELQDKIRSLGEQLNRNINKYQTLKQQHEAMSQVIAKLHLDKDHLVQQNIRLKQANSQKELSENNLVQERKRITEKITQDFKVKIRSLEEKCQETTKNYNYCRAQNSEFVITVQKNQIQIKELTTKLQEKQAEISHFEEQTKMTRVQNEKITKQLHEINSKLFSSQSERKRQLFMSENLTKRIHECLKKIGDLEQNKQEEVDQTQNIEVKLKNVALKFEKLMIESRSVKLHKEEIQKSFQRYRKQAEKEVQKHRLQTEERQQTIKKMEQMIKNVLSQSNIKETSLQKDIDLLKTENQIKTKQITYLQKKFEQRDTEFKHHAKKISQLQRQINLLEQEQVILIREKDKQITELENQLQKTQQELYETNQMFAKKEKTLEQVNFRLTINLNDLIKVKAQKQLEIQELNKIYNNVCSKHEQCTKKQRQAQKNHENQINSLKASLQHEKQVNDELHTKYQNLQYDHRNALQERQHYWATTNSNAKIEYERKVLSMTAEMKIHRDQIQSLKRQYESEIKRLSHNLEKERRLVQTISEKHKQQIESRDHQLFKLKNKYSEAKILVAQLEKYRKKYNRIKGEFDDQSLNETEQQIISQRRFLEESSNVSTQFNFENQYSNLLQSQRNFPDQRPSQEIIETVPQKEQTTEKKENKFEVEVETIKVIKLTKGAKQVYEQEINNVRCEINDVEVREFESEETQMQGQPNEESIRQQQPNDQRREE